MYTASFHCDSEQFTIIQTCDETLGALSNWIALHPPSDKLKPVYIVGGGGSDFIGCEIIRMIAARKGKLFIRQAFSFGVCYAMAKISDISEMTICHSHAASGEDYKTLEEKVLINKIHRMQMEAHSHLFVEKYFQRYIKYHSRFENKDNWKLSEATFSLVWDDASFIFKI